MQCHSYFGFTKRYVFFGGSVFSASPMSTNNNGRFLHSSPVTASNSTGEVKNTMSPKEIR